MAPYIEQYRLLFEHYKLAVEDIARMSDRRRINSDVYIGLNTFMLTGMVFLLSLSHLSSWLLPSLFLIITVLAYFINRTWRHSLNSYRQMINLRVEFIQHAEQKMQQLYQRIVDAADEPFAIGIFVKEVQFAHQPGFTRVELRLTRLFLVVFPLITLLTVVLTSLTITRHLPGLSL
ncbi:MAG: hypothetical protein H0U76_30415 [Ktedonobacteraceae bacterium]|nr:hypothetical protein [Ktedonobacteraceae bacterium]MBA3824061.1 hypothetical protein [Ktedonobacterales bacterium]